MDAHVENWHSKARLVENFTGQGTKIQFGCAMRSIFQNSGFAVCLFPVSSIAF